MRRKGKGKKGIFAPFVSLFSSPFLFPVVDRERRGREAEAAGIEGKIIGSLHPPPPTSENEKGFLLLLLLLLRRDKV